MPSLGLASNLLIKDVLEALRCLLSQIAVSTKPGSNELAGVSSINPVNGSSVTGVYRSSALFWWYAL
jgi:hypothetical protein